MRDYLVFQLYGPLLAWGDIAVGETRPSALTPSKSAVLGLVAAALGVKRPDTVADETERMACEKQHAELAQGYGLGVFVQVLGSPLSDYHTAQVPSSGTGRNRKVFPTRRDELTWLPRADLNTILSRREYRQDAYAACALWRRESAGGAPSLVAIRDKLLEPRFPLYLGRKACPLALPLHPTLRSAETLEAALADIDWQRTLAALWGEPAAERLSEKFNSDGGCLMWDVDAETSIPADRTMILTRRDQPLSRRRWQFAVREERRVSWPARGTP